MRIWLVCFGVLFAIAEVYQWVKHLMLPLPMYILGGAALAIASNYNKRPFWVWRNSNDQVPPDMLQPSRISFTIRSSEQHYEQQ